jgi:thymidylate synthase (FAD)
MRVTYVDHAGSDLSVVNAARVSFDKWHETFDQDKDTRLIRFLARHNHISPFNHTFITLHVKAPVFVARQLVKHKFMPWNEMSGRYVTFEPEFHTPDEFRAKAEDKKQGSGEAIKDDSILRMIFAEAHHDAFKAYESALSNGLCEEQARGLLPLDLMTQWFWSGTLGAWASMYNLRTKPDAQAETRNIAEQAGNIIAPLFPVSWEALTQ